MMKQHEKMEIRKPCSDDAKEIAFICSEGWKQTVSEQLSIQYQMETIKKWYNLDRVQEDIDKGNYTYVATDSEKLIGVIGGGITAPKVGEIYVFYVSEKYRYQGVGKELLATLTKEQRKNGIMEQWVSVQQGNHRGIPFYEARGFHFHSTKVNDTKTREKQVSLRYYRKWEF